MKAKPIPLSVRRAVAARSGGLCEFCEHALAVHVHHRKLRSQGGEHATDNLIHLRAACHDFAHRNPRSAQALGLIAPRHRDPADVPVKRLEFVPSGLDEFTAELTHNPDGAA